MPHFQHIDFPGEHFRVFRQCFIINAAHIASEGARLIVSNVEIGQRLSANSLQPTYQGISVTLTNV